MQNIATKYVLYVFSALAAFGLTSCEQSESNKLAQAQKCLDHVDESNPTSANSCLQYVADLDSEQANIIKCSVTFLAGGLTTVKIANAYKQLDGNSAANKEAIFINTLSLSPVSAATNATSYCQKTGIAGLIYLANLSVIGSNIMNLFPGFNPSVPPSSSDVQTAIQNCRNTPGSCNDAQVGSAAISVANAYCSGSNASTSVCQKINDAVNNSNGDPANIAQALYQYLN